VVTRGRSTEPVDERCGHVLAAVVAVIAWVAATRTWPHVAAWRQRRYRAYLASEDFAFDQAAASLKSHRLSDAIGHIAAWLSRLPDSSSAECARLEAALAALGAALYGRDPQPHADGQWSRAVTELHAARQAHLAAEKRDNARRALPALNPGRTP